MKHSKIIELNKKQANLSKPLFLLSKKLPIVEKFLNLLKFLSSLFPPELEYWQKRLTDFTFFFEKYLPGEKKFYRFCTDLKKL